MLNREQKKGVTTSKNTLLKYWMNSFQVGGVYFFFQVDFPPNELMQIKVLYHPKNQKHISIIDIIF